jgi:hypothetical protein
MTNDTRAQSRQTFEISEKDMIKNEEFERQSERRMSQKQIKNRNIRSNSLDTGEDRASCFVKIFGCGRTPNNAVERKKK